MKPFFRRKNDLSVSCSTNEEFQYDRFEVIFKKRLSNHIFLYSFDIATEQAPSSVDFTFSIQSGGVSEVLDSSSIFIVNTNEFNRVTGFFEYTPNDNSCDIVLKYRPREMGFVSVKNLKVIGFET